MDNRNIFILNIDPDFCKLANSFSRQFYFTTYIIQLSVKVTIIMLSFHGLTWWFSFAVLDLPEKTGEMGMSIDHIICVINIHL